MTHVHRNLSRRSERRRVWWAVLAASLLAGPMARAAGNIDPANNFAWSENAGWINFGPTNGGVTITNGSFYGYAWSENVGWIHLNGSPTYGVRTTANLVAGMAIYFR